ncbi:hypothetical protein [Citrobacter koseri]|uniref:hypothetical protein n=1 Tax=Citrobacter koseri TaxID=545 RepID=UPI0038915C39
MRNKNRLKKTFENGTVGEISAMIKEKLPSVESDYKWHGRGLRLLFTIIEIMVYLRGNKHCVITYEKIIKLIEIKKSRSAGELRYTRALPGKSERVYKRTPPCGKRTTCT